MQSPLLTLLRRLEAQNIWRVTYNALPQQQQYNTSSAQHHVEGRMWDALCLFWEGLGPAWELQELAVGVYVSVCTRGRGGRCAQRGMPGVDFFAKG